MRSGKNLLMQHQAGSGLLTINDWFTNSANQVNQIEAGGQFLAGSDVQQLVNAMAVFGSKPVAITSLSAQQQNDFRRY